MRLYAVAMFVHILGVIALFGSFVIVHRVPPRLRGATRYDAARPLAELLFTMRLAMPSGAIMLLASGGYLAYRLGGQPPAWVLVAAAAVLLIGLAGFAVVVPYARDVQRALAQGDGALGADAARTLGRTGLATAAGAANGAALGVLWLMTARPGVVESVSVVTVATVVGALVGRRAARRLTPGPPDGRAA